MAWVEEEEDLSAVREAVSEWQAGDRGVPLDEAVQSIRRAQRRWLTESEIEGADDE